MQATNSNKKSLNTQTSVSGDRAMSPEVREIFNQIEAMASEGAAIEEVIYKIMSQGGVQPNDMSSALEHLGFTPDAVVELFQKVELLEKDMIAQQQAQAQQPQQAMMPQAPMGEQQMSPEELDMMAEQAGQQLMQSEAMPSMAYGGTNKGTGPLFGQENNIPHALYLPPTPRRGNLLGAAYLLDDAYGELFSKQDANEDGLMDGTFRDWSAKMARYKGKQNLNKTFDVDYGNLDPSNYVVNFNDFAEGNIRTRDQYTNDLLLNSRVDFDPEANDYKSAMASNDLERKMIGKNNRVSGISLARFMENIDNMDPEEKQMLLGAKDYKSGTGLINTGNQYSSYNIAGNKALGDMYRRTMLGETENDQPLPAMISSNTPERSVVQIPPIDDTQEGSNDGFKDWYVANATNPRLMGLNEAQLREIYKQESQFKYGGSTLPKAQYGRKDFESDEEWAEYLRNYNPMDEITTPRFDGPFRAIGNIINGLGGGDWDYWDDYDRTLEKETANLGALLTSPKNWVWTDDDGYEPLPNYNQYADKDEAFAAARKNLGRGKSFLYDGIRYTTNYKDEAPNDETEEILKRATKGLSDEETKRFREVWQRAGQPPLTFGLDDERYSIPAYDAGWLDFATGSDRRRPHVNLINRDNKVYLGREGMTDEQAREKILDELSHNMQIRRDGTFESLYRFGKGGLREWMNPKYEPYDDTSAFEGEAHEVIQPLLSDYVYKGGDFPEFKYGAELPKAQFGPPYSWSGGSGMGGTYFDETALDDVAEQFDRPLAMPVVGLNPKQVDLSSLTSEAAMPELRNIDLSAYSGNQTTEQPTVTRRRQLRNIPKQIETFIQDNPYMQAYGDVSNFAVMGANFANEFFAEQDYFDYKNELRNSTIADRIYRAVENPANKRGTFDVNLGLAEPDNLVDYYAPAMYGKEMYKKGGEFEPHMMYDPKTGKGYKAKVPADHERMAKMGYVHKDEMQLGGEKDYVDEVKTAYSNNHLLGYLEHQIDNSLGSMNYDLPYTPEQRAIIDEVDRAQEDLYRYEDKLMRDWDYDESRFTEEDKAELKRLKEIWENKKNSDAYKSIQSAMEFRDVNSDPLRHSYSSAITAQTIADKAAAYIPFSDYLPHDEIIGAIGANILGAGHEASVFGKDERPFMTKARESGMDMYNNFLGSLIGATTNSPEEAAALVEEAVRQGYTSAGKIERKYGGELEVDNDTLAALIAAGADIEML